MSFCGISSVGRAGNSKFLCHRFESDIPRQVFEGSSVWESGHSAQAVVGSNPTPRAKFGVVGELVNPLLCKGRDRTFEPYPRLQVNSKRNMKMKL